MNRVIAVVVSANTSGFRSQMLQASASVRAFESNVGGMGSRTSRIGAGLKALFTGLAVAAAMFFANAVSQAVAFEGAMRNVNSISALSETQLASLSSQVLELSTQLPQSAQTLAEGLYEVSSSGFQGAAGMEVLKQSALAASAGLTDTDVASRAIVASLNAYGLTASDAADVSDILFQTVNLGVVSFEELATQLGDVVGGAAAAGVALDEVGAATAAMTLAGLSAAESTTSLNQLIRALIDPSDALGNMFQSLGYESGKAALDALGLHGTMELLRETTGGNIETLLQLFPEIRSARGAFALMSADGQNYARTFAGITSETERAGATQRAFNEQMKGLGQQWRIFINQVNAAAIEIGTALIPVLRRGMEAAQSFGSGLASTFQDVASAAAPSLEAVGRAIENVGRFLEALRDEVSPVARAFATMVGAAAIGALHGLANALSAVAGFLADHPGLVRAVAIAYGGILVARLAMAVGAFVKLQAVAGIGFTAMQKWATLQGVFSTLGTRIGVFAGGLNALRLGQFASGLSSMRTAMSGLGSVMTSPAVLGVAFVAALYAWQTGMDTAQRKAREMVEGIENSVNSLDMSTIHTGMEEINRQLQAQGEIVDNYGRSGSNMDKLTGTIRGAVEVLTPLENRLMDAAEAEDALGVSARNLERMQAGLSDALSILSDEFGITGDQARQLLESMEFDPAIWGNFSSDEISEFKDQVIGATAAAQNATPAQQGVADAMTGVADATASAEDQVESFNDALEAMIGIALGAWDAETRYAQGIQELTQSFIDNGLSMDAWTEKGRANRTAMSEAVTGAQEYASAIMEQGGSAQEAANHLTMFREQLINTATGAGMAREEAEGLINSLGLTPQSIETLFNMENLDSSQAEVDVFTASMNAIETFDVNVPISIEDQGFEMSAQNIADFLLNVSAAEPQATFHLDDAPFQATRGQVEDWIETYGNTTAEAQALLDIIDPADRFATLQEWLNGWDNSTASADADVNSENAHVRIQAAKDNLASWGASRGTGTVDANGVPARVTIEQASAHLQAWAASEGTSDVNANDNASGLIGRVQALLSGWNSSSGSSDVNANDNASGVLSRVESMLNRLDGRTANTYVTNTVTNRTIFEEQRRGFTTSGPQLRRWGGIDNAPRNAGMTRAASGLLANVYQNTGAVYFAEPETGGEAFVPRHGNRARALQVLDEAAGWHGADLVPQGMRPPGGGASVVINFNPSLTMQMTGTTGLDPAQVATEIERRMNSRLSEYTTKLTRELAMR